MSVQTVIGMWTDIRNGFIAEVERIPDDQFSFRATEETRSVAELVQHIIETQKILVGETCRPETNLMRQSFPDHTKEYASGVSDVADKASLIELLRSSMTESTEKISSYSDNLDESMLGFNGKPLSKIDFLTSAMGHEMYHRGQLTVFERLLNVEPALTGRLKKLFASAK